MTEEKKVMDAENLEEVTGGNSQGIDIYHDLDRFVAHRVKGVIHYNDTACLTMRMQPNGDIIWGVGWQNGDIILINKHINENGWLFAYKNGLYGYVNGAYVD